MWWWKQTSWDAVKIKKVSYLTFLLCNTSDTMFQQAKLIITVMVETNGAMMSLARPRKMVFRQQVWTTIQPPKRWTTLFRLWLKGMLIWWQEYSEDLVNPRETPSQSGGTQRDYCGIGSSSLTRGWIDLLDSAGMVVLIWMDTVGLCFPSQELTLLNHAADVLWTF